LHASCKKDDDGRREREERNRSENPTQNVHTQEETYHGTTKGPRGRSRSQVAEMNMNPTQKSKERLDDQQDLKKKLKQPQQHDDSLL